MPAARNAEYITACLPNARRYSGGVYAPSLTEGTARGSRAALVGSRAALVGSRAALVGSPSAATAAGRRGQHAGGVCSP
jgi:hypothetical protein